MVQREYRFNDHPENSNYIAQEGIPKFMISLNILTSFQESE